MKKFFDLKDINLIFTNGGSKLESIIENNLSTYYGDGDGDILDSIQAGAQGVRILRAKNSNAPRQSDINSSSYPGAFGEVVILDSDK